MSNNNFGKNILGHLKAMTRHFSSKKRGQFDKFGREIRYIEIPNRVLKSHEETILDPLTGLVVGERVIIDKLRPIRLGYDRKNINLRKSYAEKRAWGQVLC